MYLIGLDVGTTGAKAILIDEQGLVVAEAVGEYPLSTPRAQWAEQDPEDWWRASVGAFRDILHKANIPSNQISGIGLTGQMHGLVLLDDQGCVLRPAILWNDQRTGRICERITGEIGFRRLLELTGNPVLPGFTAPKIVWVRENEPEIYRKVSHFLLPKDYVRFRLTGQYSTEVSDASGTSLFDMKRRVWSEEMFAALDIPLAWAPRCFESPEITGRVLAEAARETGLADGTPVVGGGGDQAAQAIGSGLATEGLVSATIGTSGVVFAPTKKPIIDQMGRMHSFCHAIPGMWHVMGVMLAAGGSLRWYRDALCQKEMGEAESKGVDPYEIILAEAAKAPVGCEGLIFLPYLTGERTPHPDPNARGVFAGLTIRHEKRHLTRAVLEGVGFGLLDSLNLIRELGLRPEQVRISGGGARSVLWRQILSDQFNVEVVTINATEGACFGAALLAGVGVNIYGDVREACQRTIRTLTSNKPDKESANLYQQLYPVYDGLYEKLKDDFARLTSIASPEA